MSWGPTWELNMQWHHLDCSTQVCLWWRVQAWNMKPLFLWVPSVWGCFSEAVYTPAKLAAVSPLVHRQLLSVFPFVIERASLSGIFLALSLFQSLNKHKICLVRNKNVSKHVICVSNIHLVSTRPRTGHVQYCSKAWGWKDLFNVVKHCVISFRLKLQKKLYIVKYYYKLLITTN